MTGRKEVAVGRCFAEVNPRRGRGALVAKNVPLIEWQDGPGFSALCFETLGLQEIGTNFFRQMDLVFLFPLCESRFYHRWKKRGVDFSSACFFRFCESDDMGFQFIARSPFFSLLFGDAVGGLEAGDDCSLDRAGASVVSTNPDRLVAADFRFIAQRVYWQCL